MTLCRIETCVKPSSSTRGLCNGHRNRLYRYGNPTFSPRSPVRSYAAIHVAKRAAAGSASQFVCSIEGCTDQATSWAFRPVPGVEILTQDVRGTVLHYQDHLDSLRPECSRCHSRADTILRAGRCKRDEAENFLLDLIDRHGEVLLGGRVYAAADAAGIERWSLVDTPKRWGIRTRQFHGADGRVGSVSVWIVAEHMVPAPGQRKAGAA